MGYYTRFDISNNSQEVVDAINIGSGYDDVQEDSIKWYSCLDDCKRISKDFPDTVIEVSGEGEEVGDIWTAYFKNGKMQYEKAQIVLGEYDESKLK